LIDTSTLVSACRTAFVTSSDVMSATSPNASATSQLASAAETNRRACAGATADGGSRQDSRFGEFASMLDSMIGAWLSFPLRVGSKRLAGQGLITARRGTALAHDERNSSMAVLLALLVVALLFGLGFAVKVLWFVAVLALAVWIIGFFAAGAERRWYHW
jgi:hypothetical protein